MTPTAPNQDDELKAEIHRYDDIEELDNSLPSWWIKSFYLTIIFAAGYFAYYVIGGGRSLKSEYEHAKSEYEYSLLAQKAHTPTLSEQELRAFLRDPARVKAGHEVFEAKCIPCHGAQGQGGIGPNLTDDYWLHGGQMTEIVNTVTNGVPEKGMPPWGPVLSREQIYSVVTFVKSLHGSNPPNAKAPQGNLVKE